MEFSLSNYVRKLQLHYICGRHSGIPLCCVIYFIITREILESIIGSRLFYKFLKSNIFNRYLEGFEYIACPYCSVFNKPKKIRDCGTDGTYRPFICNLFSREYIYKIFKHK